MGERDIRYGPDMSPERAQHYIDTYMKCADALIARKDELRKDMDPAVLEQHLALLEEAHVAARNAGSLFGSHLRNHTDDDAIRSKEALFARLGAEYGEKMLYFSQELKSWGSDALLALAKKIPTYAAYLQKKARRIQFQLSEAEERIINFKDLSGAERVLEVYLMLTSRYEYDVEIDGERKTLTGPELRALRLSKDREKRKLASTQYLKPYYEDDAILLEMYRSIVTDWDVECVKLRGYDDPIHARHVANDIDAATYEALCSIIPRLEKIFDRYHKLKMKLLGYDTFHTWDLYAPIEGLPENISYEDALTRTFEAYEQFAPWFKDLAKQITDNGRADVYPRKHKEGGACCFYFSKGELPAMSLNHVDNYGSLTTIAHELGHCVHALLEREDGRTLGVGAPLTLAETGSNWGEMLVFDHVRSKGSKQEQIALLCDKIDDTYASTITQLRYVEFEKQAHKLLEEGAGKEELHALWEKLQRESSTVIEWGENTARWMSIPHIFHTPFYCYAYSFGILLTLALYARYDQEGESFVSEIRGILASGGRLPAAELLAKYDMDITSSAFWNNAADLVEKWVDDLESLI